MDEQAVEAIRHAARPLPGIEEDGFGASFDHLGAARIVMLGEASHGTSEFYRARAAITKRLIKEHGFTIVAVEADWPDAACFDRKIKGVPARDDDTDAFARFPRWMWRNREVEAFIGWLTQHNRTASPEGRAGFYGLDLYNLGGSMREVVDYLEGVDPDAAALARERYACLSPWVDNPAIYGHLAVNEGYTRCADGVVAQLSDMFTRSREFAAQGGEEFLDATQNARLVANAEAYYRAMYLGAAESWNLRDSHMFETLENLLAAKGPDSKAVVWAHNSHIGDARATGMGRERGEHNIGQLVREVHGSDARLVGFGTHTGTVAAATDWDGPMEIKSVNPSRPDSYERLCHDTALPRFHLNLRDKADVLEAMPRERLERFIGVIYRPDTERWSHYSGANLLEQFDDWVWFDETRAVSALDDHEEQQGEAGGDDLYPSGM